MKTTLVTAIVMEEPEAFEFVVKHKPSVEAHQIPNRMAQAFDLWAATEEGKQFIEENGCNWGDSLYIPTEFLRKVDLKSILPLLFFTGQKFELLDTKNVSFDHRITVDHDETLVGVLEI